MAIAETPSSEPQNPAANEGGGGSFVVKSDVASLLYAGEASGVAGEFMWPVHPNALATLYRASSEHGRACQIKAETAFGNGMLGERADELDDICGGDASELFVALGLDLEVYGNAFCQKIMATDGRLISLRLLPALTMSRFRGGFMQRVLLDSGETKIYTFTSREILHLRVKCPLGKRYALPTWIGAEGMLDLAQSAIKFNASFFRNNAMPEWAVIFTGGSPSKEQKRAIQEFFRNEYRGLDNQHRTLVLNANEDCKIEFEKLTADMKEADFLKLLAAALDRLPIAHGVPPRMLGIMTAGQLGGGGEVSSQLFIFEHLTLRPKRRSMLGQFRSVLALLGLKPGKNPLKLADDEIAFAPLDLTPPADDRDALPDLVNSEIVTPEEARQYIDWLNVENGERASRSHSTKKSADTPQSADHLIALLAQL